MVEGVQVEEAEESDGISGGRKEAVEDEVRWGESGRGGGGGRMLKMRRERK